MSDQVVLTRGHIITMDPSRPSAEALLISDGQVAKVGTSQEVEAAAGKDARWIDLGGRFVLPGLIDAHTHVEFCALSRAHWIDVRRQTSEQSLAIIAQHAEAAAEISGTWLVAQGTYGQDLPTRAAIDSVAPNVPVLVRESMHRLVANSRALEIAGMSSGYTSPIGTRVELGEDGTPNGLVEEGFHLFPVPWPDDDALADLLESELRESFARHGVTTIYELPATAAGVRAYQRLERAGRLPTRLSLNLVVAPGLNPLLGDIDEWVQLGLTSGFGGHRLWLGAVKVFMDGDDSASWDRSHMTGPVSTWGVATRHYADLVSLLVKATAGDLQVWIHAIGDAAQDLALDALIEARRVSRPKHVRHRLEHVANLWMSQELLDRIEAADVIPVPTAAFLHSDNGSGVYAYRRLLDRGMRPPGNSDTAGTQPFATNPWFGIACMADRINQHGDQVAPAEAVTVLEGIETYTSFAAEAGHRAGRIGILREGAFGDCAIYSSSPLSLSTAELRSLEADVTLVGGEVVWTREGVPA